MIIEIEVEHAVADRVTHTRYGDGVVESVRVEGPITVHHIGSLIAVDAWFTVRFDAGLTLVVPPWDKDKLAKGPIPF